LALVESVRKIGNQTTTSKRYYLNSFSSNAQLFQNAVRSHWDIENSLHWVLDVGFREDNCPIYSDHVPDNLAQLRKMSLNSVIGQAACEAASLTLNLLLGEKTAKIGVANKRCGMHRQASTQTRSGEPVG
jgi:Transposase DDE domain